MSRILLTGAAGRLGRKLREHYGSLGRDVLATDIVQPADAPPLALADLADRTQVDDLMARDVSAVVHFGGMSKEEIWADVLNANIVGTYNVFESARKAGVRRIVFASTYHVVGMYPLAELPVDIHAAPRPDSLYGVSKLFGENLARLYHDKFGIEFICIRVCTAGGPGNARELHLYCDWQDLADLALHALDAPKLGFKLAYGISETENPWCVNDPEAVPGWEPRHNANDLTPPNGITWPPINPEFDTLGGVFSKWGHPDDGKQQ